MISCYLIHTGARNLPYFVDFPVFSKLGPCSKLEHHDFLSVEVQEFLASKYEYEVVTKA